MKTSEILIKAKSLIDSPEKWTQEVFARDAKKQQVEHKSPDAVCFCSLGALSLVAGKDSYDFATARQYLRAAIGDQFIASFNDDHTHEEVMSAWDKAIQISKQDEV